MRHTERTGPNGWTLARRLMQDLQTQEEEVDADLYRSLSEMGLLHTTADGRCIGLTELLHGVTVTHRLSAAEVAGGYLVVDPDLTVLEAPLLTGVSTTCGAPVDLRPHTALLAPSAARPDLLAPRVAVGPADWLTGFSPGEGVAVQLIDATLVVLPCTIPPADPPVVAAVTRRAGVLMDHAQRHGAGRVAQLLAILVEGDLDGDGVLSDTTTATWTDVLAAGGLATKHGWVTDAEEGTGLDRMCPAGEGPTALLLDAIDVDPRTCDLLSGAIVRHRMQADDPYSGHRRGVLDALTDLTLVKLVGVGLAGSAGIPRLVADLVEGAPRRSRAGLHTLAVFSHLAHGNVAQAERSVELALKTSDDGWLQETLATLRWWRRDHASALGSAHGGLSPADPVGAGRDLWSRARSYTIRNPLFDQMSRMRDDLDANGLSEALDEDGQLDLVVERYAGLDRFVLEVGPSLDPAEQALLAQWQQVQRRWWRVESVVGDVVRLRGLDGGSAVEAWLPYGADPGLEGADPIAGTVMSALLLPLADGQRWLAPGCFAVDRPLESLPPAEDVLAILSLVLDTGWQGLAA